MDEVHHLKIETQYFKDLKKGLRNFEVRYNDRKYKEGDTLILQEYDPVRGKYLSGWIAEKVISVFSDNRFVKEGFVILATEEIKVDGKRNKIRK